MIPATFGDYLQSVAALFNNTLDLLILKHQKQYLETTIPLLLKPFNFTSVEETKVSSYLFNRIFKPYWAWGRRYLYERMQREKAAFMTTPDAALWNSDDMDMRVQIMNTFFTISSEEIKAYHENLETETKKQLMGDKAGILLAIMRV